ncbi:MAG: AI-2E family transporter [Alphaproteobacteria bacterium]|nr:AI-2E family transporter [Alphaproteobacteria bacterium]
MRLGSLSIFWIVVVALLGSFLWLFQGILTPFVLGMVIAYLLNPLVKKLQQYGWPRWAAVLTLLTSFLLVMGLGIGLLVPVLMREAAQLAQDIPAWLNASQQWATATAAKLGISNPTDTAAVVQNIQDQAGNILKASRNILTGVVAGGAAILSFFSFLFLMPIVAFYMMLDWPKLVARFNDLLPRGKAPTVNTLMGQADQTLAGFIRGQLTVCMLLGLFYGIGLSLIGLKFGFVIGLLAGILSIMPYVGSGFGLLAAVGVAWFTTGDPVMVLSALLVFAIGQFIEGNFLTPKLVGENIGLHPLWVIFALMAGGSLLGFTGLLIAVPVAAVIGVLVRFAIAEYKKSHYYTAG